MFVKTFHAHLQMFDGIFDGMLAKYVHEHICTCVCPPPPFVYEMYMKLLILNLTDYQYWLPRLLRLSHHLLSGFLNRRSQGFNL